MDPKSITNGTNLAQGVGKGYPKINENMKKFKKRKSKEAKQDKTFWGECGTIFSKIGGLNGWAFTVVLSTTVTKHVYKT